MFVYFATFNAFMRKQLLQSHQSAELAVEVLFLYRNDGRYLLHEFVIMPDHVHLILSPLAANTLPHCIQLIKGTIWVDDGVISTFAVHSGKRASMTSVSVTSTNTLDSGLTCIRTR
jgi:hypothetical protein